MYTSSARLKKFVLLSFAALICCCTLAQGAKSDTVQTPAKNTVRYAMFYFYRSYIPKMVAPVKKVPIYINDTLVYSLKANMLVGIKVYKEGNIVIAIDKKGESEIVKKVKFGNEYFFRCAVEAGLWFGKPTIEEVTPKVGREESGAFNNQ